ncbi:MAG: GtrA family protein [Rubrivivax sp.]|jgi:putative flippase GtrA
MTASSFADERADPALTPIDVRVAEAGSVWRQEFFRYLLCSALALSVDWGVYSLALAVGLPWAGAATLGFGGGLFVAYLLSIRFAFVRRSLRDPRVEFMLFGLIGVAGLVLMQVILWLLIERFGHGPHESKLAATGFVFLFNFSARKLLLFRARLRPVPSH